MKRDRFRTWFDVGLWAVGILLFLVCLLKLIFLIFSIFA